MFKACFKGLITTGKLSGRLLVFLLFGLKQIFKLIFRKKNTSFGSASFANPKRIQKAESFKEKGFILGKIKGQFLRFKKPGHLICFAPTRTGKGTGLVIPNALDHPGSLVVTDIKGENLAVAGRQRTKFGEVFALAPFAAYSSCYNPLDFIRVGQEEEGDDAAKIVEMLVVGTPGVDPFWDKEAKSLLKGLILYVVHHKPDNLKNLGEMRHILMSGPDDFEQYLRLMEESKNPLIHQVANSMFQKEPKLRSSVISTAQSHTHIWDSKKLLNITSHSDFQIEDLKENPMSLFLVIPPENLETHQPFLRLMVGLSLAAMTRNEKRPKDNVLFLLDEFPALGRLQPVENAIAYQATYGVSLWLLVQDLNQLKTVYGQSYKTFISNCNVRQAFGVSDYDTAKILSDMLGRETISIKSHSSSGAFDDLVAPDRLNQTTSHTGRALLTPDEIMRLPSNEQLIFLQGERPIKAEKIEYFREGTFQGMFDEWAA